MPGLCISQGPDHAVRRGREAQAAFIQEVAILLLAGFPEVRGRAW